MRRDEAMVVHRLMSMRLYWLRRLGQGKGGFGNQSMNHDARTHGNLHMLFLASIGRADRDTPVDSGAHEALQSKNRMMIWVYCLGTARGRFTLSSKKNQGTDQQRQVRYGRKYLLPSRLSHNQNATAHTDTQTQLSCLGNKGLGASGYVSLSPQTQTQRLKPLLSRAKPWSITFFSLTEARRRLPNVVIARGIRKYSWPGGLYYGLMSISFNSI
ncbi:hypothetical protein DM02DRAFT_323297 [Periconia macrospinosa]|uniref:Uncharacterized protein n=1 Tax=Periconia macrospinosa TaxID=97972 RepID=A0A2V1EBE3_9PLEO|nr:hypothetical protein DM02DRAFT_323297 [Periconia macrospinosa]